MGRTPTHTFPWATPILQPEPGPEDGLGRGVGFDGSRPGTACLITDAAEMPFACAAGGEANGNSNNEVAITRAAVGRMTNGNLFRFAHATGRIIPPLIQVPCAKTRQIIAAHHNVQTCSHLES